MTATDIITHLKNASRACTDGYECSLSIREVRHVVALLDRVWQPIETAPLGESGKPETYFIGGRQDGNRINIATCYRNEHGAYEWWGGGLTPTHWMPIPPMTAPEVEQFVKALESAPK